MKIRSLACVAALLLGSCQSPLEADLVLAGGEVYVGDISGSFTGDVAVKDGDIVYVGAPNATIRAKRRVDVTGMVVAPGFIDPHTHSLSDLLSEDEARRRNDNYRFQGVTTVFSGNDGGGSPHIGETREALLSRGIGTNTGLFVGHGKTRSDVMGQDNRAPTQEELREMERLVELGMTEGALGLSTGLFYAPGSFSQTDEVVSLAKVAAKYGGVYDSHIRDESTYNIGLEASIDEALQIGTEADIPVHIAHIKALGVDVWGQSAPIIEKINKARAGGQKITADQYPWSASGTRISNALLPRWVKAGTREEYMARLEDDALRPRLLAETSENLRRRGGPKAVLITEDKQGWQGLTLDQIAINNNMSPEVMAIEIAKMGDAGIASFNMNEDDITAFMTQDWVMTGSDGSSGHPRKYASFPRKYETYIQKNKVMDVDTFIYRSSGLAAQTFNLCDRGFLKADFKADIVVFDPNSFRPLASYHDPEKLSAGVAYLIVNGEPVIDAGVSQESLPGDVVRSCNAKPDNGE